MFTPLVSIIVPIYKTRQYIEQCLSSLINQTYQNLELILIDDGNTDDTLEYLTKIAQEDTRIRVFSQENKGLSASRNIGLSYAKGEWVFFVDSDDWIEKETIETCIHAISNDDFDLVFFDYMREFGTISKPVHLFNQSKEFNEIECRNLRRRMIGPYRSELTTPTKLYSLSTAWKLYKREIAKKYSFVDTKIIGTAEDALFNIQYYQDVKKALYLHYPFYHYRRNNENSVTAKGKILLSQQLLELFKLIKQLISSPEEEEAYYNLIAVELYQLGLNEIHLETSFMNRYKKIKSILSSDLYKKSLQALSLRYFPLHWKIFFFNAKYKLYFLFYLSLYVLDFARYLSTKIK